MVMARAPFQVLVIPFVRGPDAVPRYAVLRRADLGVWQGIAGGGEDGESPEEAARREAAEEAGVPRDAPLIRLTAVGRIPATHFAGRAGWGPGVRDIPEYCFGIALPAARLELSGEHAAAEWLDYDAAMARLEWESNRAALKELHRHLVDPCSLTSP
jgi:dATP pyrophosphohydrolase